MQQQIIDIIIPSSDKYMPYVSVLLVSALENINKNYKLFFHILTEDIRQETINKVEMLKRHYDFDIEYKYLNAGLSFELPYCVNTHIDSKIVYAKLMISSLFPNLERAIILEGDMIVTGDLSELWSINIDNYCIAAAKDAWYKCHRTPETNPYFNTGMFYANLNKWREINFEQRAIELAPTMELKFPDQDLFNAIFKDKVLYLDWCWNAATCVYEKWFNVLDEAEKEQMVSNHKILHYIHKIKPWTTFNSRYGEYFWYYAKLTPFYEKIFTDVLNLPLNKTPNDTEIIKITFKYRENILKYWRYKFLYLISQGKKKEHYKNKKAACKEKIREAKNFLR